MNGDDWKHDYRCSGECGPCGGVGGVPGNELAMSCLHCGGSGKCVGCSDAYQKQVEDNLRRWAEEP